MRHVDPHTQSPPRAGLQVPGLTLPSTVGQLDLRVLCASRAVLYFYPATGVPGRDPALDPAPGWDEIPGAAGCTSQCLGFKEAFDGFANRAIQVAGISSQPLAEQLDFVEHHSIPFPLICDDLLRLQRAWSLPTFSVGGRIFLRRLALYIVANQIEQVLYPITAPSQNAEHALELLGDRPGAA